MKIYESGSGHLDALDILRAGQQICDVLRHLTRFAPERFRQHQSDIASEVAVVLAARPVDLEPAQFTHGEPPARLQLGDRLPKKGFKVLFQSMSGAMAAITRMRLAIATRRKVRQFTDNL